MTVAVYRRHTCRLCNESDLALVLQLTPTPIGDAYVTADSVGQVQQSFPIDLFLCRSCGHTQLLDVIPAEILYRDYLYVTASSLGLADHFQSYADDTVSRFRPRSGALVVDIGSNDGTLLKCFQNRGMKVLGVDAAPEIAQKATAVGIETLPVVFTVDVARHIRQEYGPAAIITANNVFANIDDLTSLTNTISSLLAPDGVFLFESYYLPDLIQNMVFDFIYHEHISSFSVKPLQAFFQRSGLELIDVSRVPTKGGSIRYTVQHAGGPHVVSSTVAKQIEFEISFGLYKEETFKSFDAKINSLKAQNLSLLQDFKAKGKTIAGYGASVTATTLIYHFGLGSIIEFIVDDNPAKQNRFSPGLHLPVYTSDALYKQKPDYVVMLAWRYVGPIVKRHAAFLSQGGHFVVPLPKVEVI